MPHDEKRFDPQRMAYLISPERESRWNPNQFVARLGMQAGQTVLDLGAGPGFWTLPLAGIVGPQGIVWALDVSRELLDGLAARNPPPQVRSLQSTLPQIDLPAGVVDFVFGGFVFHEVEPPETLAREVRRVLKPGGHVAILDWRPDAVGDLGPPRYHRLPPERIVSALQAAGFAQTAATWQDDDAYLVEGR
jgi:ubiquinone/menaquinone biosynthesis C-methylase UbiE